ncbi:hypothetical protein [Paenibacillus faecalis]|uniref:hypothetical protein n=1 Tax=Paenibacillus faecalis TaxID=2079532 RepID=UPI000D10664D|nr:hypothetical protein [Paenibacillus faecalis]
MIARKISVCVLLFVLLIIGAAALDKHISRTQYQIPMERPLTPNYNINTTNVKESDPETQPFAPREYIRIIRRPSNH